MATGKGQTLESLYIELGLDISQLQAGILAADRSLTENLGRINRQRNIIKLRVEADIAGLDRFKDSTQILEIQERGLNQQLTLAKDKLSILEAAYQQVANNQNSSAIAVQNAEKAWQNARLEVGKLEQALKSLAAQKVSIDTTQLQENIAKLNAKIQHVKITAEIDTSKLKNSAFVFEQQKVHVAALNKELELQRQKLIELQNALKQSTKIGGADSVQSLNIKSNVLQQIQEINRLETRLKDLQNTRIDLQFKADSIRRVEAEVQENISRINAKIEHIKVKTDIDVSRLGSVASEFDKAKAHVQGLNRELTLQNQKLAELRKALSASISTNGLNNVKTINISTDVQRQIHEIDQLKAKINELGKIQPPKTNSLLSGYLNIKGDVTGKLNELTSAFSQLQGATASADSAITASLGVIGTIPHPVGRAVAAFAALPIVLRGVENSLIDMTRAAAASGDAVYVMSRGFQMSIKDTGKFSTNAKVAGTDVNSLATAIKQVQRSIVKGGDDSKAAEWLKRYGESARDANGNLKNLNEMTFALNRALHKAQEEGKGAEFIFSVFRSVSADDITAIEDWIDVNEQASAIVKAGLGNPALAHSVQGNLNALKVQSGQLNASFTNALLPVANEIIPRVTERMGELTRVISDNKDVIKQFGRDAAEVFLSIEHAAEIVIGAFGSVMKGFYDLKKRPEQDELVARFKTDLDIKSIDDLIKKAQPKAYDFIKKDPRLYAQVKAQYQPIYQAIADAQAEIKKQREELEKILAIPVSVANFSSIGQERAKLELDEGSLDSLRQARKYQEEAEAILYKIGHSDYDNQKLDLEQWRTNLLREAELSAQEREAIEQLYAAKSAQIEQERADKLQEIRDQITAADKTALENKLDNIEKERQAWIKAGMDEAEAAELAEKKRLQAMQEAHEKAQQYLKDAADIEYSLTHTSYEKQLRDVEHWKEAQMQKADTAEEVAAIVKDAAAKEAEAFEREVDRIKNATQSLEDEIFEMEHSRYETDMYRAMQKAQKALDEGVDFSVVSRWLNNKMASFNQRANEARAQGGDYVKSPTGGSTWNGLIMPQLQRSTGLLTNENAIRGRLISTLSKEAQEVEARVQAARDMNKSAQMQSAIPGNLRGVPLGNATIIQGDQITQITPADLKAEMEKFQAQMQASFGTPAQSQPQPQPPIESNPLKNLETSAQSAAEAQKTFAGSLNNLPPDYFKQLADQAKAVSTMQGNLTQSTIDLIDAQSALRDSLATFPKADKQPPAKETTQTIAATTKASSAETESQRALRQALAKLPDAVHSFQSQTDLPTVDFPKLADSTQDVSKAQDLLARTANEARTSLENIRVPEQTQTTPKDSGIKFGFDYDTAKDIFLTGAGMAAASAGTGVGLALSPEILAGAIVAAGVGGFVKGSYDETTAQPESTERPQPLSEIDLSGVITPLTSIDSNLQSVLQTLQDQSIDTADEQPYQADALQELFGELPNIRADVQSIFQELQARGEVESPVQTAESIGQDYLPTLINIDGNLQSVLTELQAQSPQETTMTFETIVTPLNNIAGLVQQVLNALANRQPPQVTVSPSISNNLGGAYVFDNAMKKSLVDDITSQIVSAITSAVQQATSQSNYSYGA